MYASVIWVVVGSADGFLPVQYQPIIWTNAIVLLIETFNENRIIYSHFKQENEFKNG